MIIPEKIDNQKELVKFLSRLNRDKLKIKSLVVEFWENEEELNKEGIMLTSFSID